MARIELVGPVGVGKSTLLHALASARRPPHPWMTPKEAELAIVSERLSKRRGVRQRLALCIPPLRRRLHRREMTLIRRDAPWHASPKWAAFLAACLDFRAADPRESVRIFMSHARIAMRVAEAIAWDTLLAGTVVVTDESLIHATLPLVVPSDTARDVDVLTRFYTQMPPPDGIVCLRGGLELNFERLMSRERRKRSPVISIRGLPETAILDRLRLNREVVDSATSAMEARGVPVAHLDPSWSLDRQQAEAARLIAAIVERRSPSGDTVSS